MIQNRKAYHDYHILEKLEVGIELLGAEVKALRANKASINEAHVQIRDNQMWLVNSHIDAKSTNGFEADKQDPKRTRRLLAHKRQIIKWFAEVQLKGLTIVPLDVHLSNGRFKLTVALAKGKKNYDKRQSIKERDIKREMQRRVKEV